MKPSHFLNYTSRRCNFIKHEVSFNEVLRYKIYFIDINVLIHRCLNHFFGIYKYNKEQGNKFTVSGNKILMK